MRELAAPLRAMARRTGSDGPLSKDIQQQLGMSHPPKAIQYGFDRHWCDSSGIFMEGWLHNQESVIDCLHVIAGDQVCEVRSFLPRPGPATPAGLPPKHGASGFRVYMPWRASDTLYFEVDSGGRVVRFPIALPAGRVRSAPWSHAEDAPVQPGVPGAHELHLAHGTMVHEVNAKRLAVAEVGSRNVSPGAQSKRALFPQASRYIGVDVHPAPNVDVTGDAHFLHELLGEASVDAVFSIAVMEHLAYPWLFAAAVNRTLTDGGLTFHATHQAWPTHEQPNDFWRFSENSMRVLFGPEMGFETLYAGMHNPAFIYPELRNQAFGDVPFSPGHCGVFVLARKVRAVETDAVRWPVARDAALARAGEYPWLQRDAAAPTGGRGL